MSRLSWQTDVCEEIFDEKPWLKYVTPDKGRKIVSSTGGSVRPRNNDTNSSIQDVRGSDYQKTTIALF